MCNDVPWLKLEVLVYCLIFFMIIKQVLILNNSSILVVHCQTNGLLLSFLVWSLLQIVLCEWWKNFHCLLLQGDHVALLSALSEMGLRLRLDLPDQAMEVATVFFRSSTPASEALVSISYLLRKLPIQLLKILSCTNSFVLIRKTWDLCLSNERRTWKSYRKRWNSIKKKLNALIP